MTAVLVCVLAVLALDSVATTVLLAVVLRRSGYRVRLWPERKPEYYA